MIFSLNIMYPAREYKKHQYTVFYSSEKSPPVG